MRRDDVVCAVFFLCALSGCMNPPYEDDGRLLDGGGDGGGVFDRGVDAGPVKPPLGHLPAGPACGAAVGGGAAHAQSALVLAGDDLDDDAGTAAVGDPLAPTLPAASDAGPSVPMPSHAGELVIAELLADPSTLDDSAGEWFELHNPTDTTFDLHGCAIEDRSATPHVLTAHLLVAARGYVTVARGTQAGFAPDATLSFSLTNSAGQLAVRCGAVVIDHVDFDKGQGFPLAPGASAQLDSARMTADDNDEPSAWCLSTSSYGPELGTPGEANTSCAAPDASAP